MSIFLTSINPSNQESSFYVQREPIETHDNYQSFKMFDEDTWWISVDNLSFKQKVELVELHKTDDSGVFEVVLKAGINTFKIGLYSATKHNETFNFS